MIILFVIGASLFLGVVYVIDCERQDRIEHRDNLQALDFVSGIGKAHRDDERPTFEIGRDTVVEEVDGMDGQKFLIEAPKGEEWIYCILCDRKSYNSNDIEYRFCGYCHTFHDQQRRKW